MWGKTRFWQKNKDIFLSTLGFVSLPMLSFAQFPTPSRAHARKSAQKFIFSLLLPVLQTHCYFIAKNAQNHHNYRVAFLGNLWVTGGILLAAKKVEF